MREFAKKFYKSASWKQTREAYAKSKGYLCERCLKEGLYTPGEIVHHKIHLSPENIKDEEITLAWENLELLCRRCHGAEHATNVRRYEIDFRGEVRLPPGG